MKITPKQRMHFEQYVRDVSQACELLQFIFDNLQKNIELNYSRESLLALERVFWEVCEKGIPAELTDQEHLVRLMSQYLGESIVRSTGAKWIQSTYRNPTFGQPALDGFGNEKWDRIYPVSLANHFVTLRETNPNFPGVKNQRVLVSLFDKAASLFEAANKTMEPTR